LLILQWESMWSEAITSLNTSPYPSHLAQSVISIFCIHHSPQQDRINRFILSLLP
jgi:hypothetical protein